MTVKRNIDLDQRAFLTIPRNLNAYTVCILELDIWDYIDVINTQPGNTHTLVVERPEGLVYGRPSFLSEALGISATGIDKIHETLGGRADRGEFFTSHIRESGTAA